MHYRYDDSGHLVGVDGATAARTYTYLDGLLASISDGHGFRRDLEYAEGGFLRRERIVEAGEVRETNWELQDGEGGVVLTARGPDGAEEHRFDASMRPTSRRLPDGTTTRWSPSGEVDETTIEAPDDGRWTVRRAATERSVTAPSGASLRAVLDPRGHLTELWRGNRRVFRRVLARDGRVERMEEVQRTVRPHYGPNGRLDSVVFVPTGDENVRTSRDWVEVRVNGRGDVERLLDPTGEDVRFERGADGFVRRVTSPRGWTEYDRDTAGHLTRVQTSWGEQEVHTVDARTGVLRRLAVTRAGSTAVTEYDPRGRVSLVRAFDGSEWRLRRLASTNRLEEIQTPSGATVAYTWSGGALHSAEVRGRYRIDYERDAAGHLVGSTLHPLQ